MHPQDAPSEADRVLRLPASLDLLAAEPLHQHLREKLEDNRPFSIDGTDVDRVSTAGLQLLVAAMIGARSRKLPVAVINPSTALADAARDLDLCAMLGLENSR